MKKLFENETTYTQDTYMDFLIFHNKLYNLPYMLYTIIWSVIFLLCIYISFYTKEIFQGILLCILLISFILYRIYKPRFIVNKELKSDKIVSNKSGKSKKISKDNDTPSHNGKNIFMFYDQNFKIRNINGLFEFKYFKLRRIFETREYFYLYVDKENAFILSKKTFSLGTSKDFSNFIKNKCRFKYKYYNYPTA